MLRRRHADATKYISLIGGLLYLTATRPNIMFAASLLSRYIQEPSQIHFGAAKRVLRYLQGTLDYGIYSLHARQQKIQVSLGTLTVIGLVVLMT